MIETCHLCGHTWGVTMTPRERVLCTPCARPTPSRRAATYWHLRLVSPNFPYVQQGTPEWRDHQTSLADLRIAADFGAKLDQP